jgi:glyoxylase-like metal-dependent hydrolase (beta-lactamase superfamily II)
VRAPALALILAGCAGRALPPSALPVAERYAVDRAALPGGTLRALEVATTHARQSIVVEGGGSTRLDLPVWVYVFEHPSEGVVLIDAGFGRRTAASTADFPGRRMTQLLGLTMEPGGALADRIGEAGLAMSDVRHIVITHKHVDHVGGIEDFPGTTVWMGDLDWVSLEQASALGKPDLRPFAAVGERAAIAWGAEDRPLGPFVASRDLFGDGSLIVLNVPGHTPGHMAVLLNLRGGSYLFTGDCAWTDPHWQGPNPKAGLVRALLEDDWRLNWLNQWRIHEFAKANPEIRVVAGHEVANRELLPKWPAKAE